jgi:FkbM family methyltransferase
VSFKPDQLGGPYYTVFDVGAFRGDFSRACRSAWPDACIYSFEPLEPQPDDLDDNWRWFPIALGPISELATMNVCEFIPSSSFLPMAEKHKTAFPYTREHTQTTVRVNTLDAFKDLIQDRALLKIDVQGYEYQVLLGGEQALPPLPWGGV